MGFGFGLGLDSSLGLLLYIGGIIAFLLSIGWKPQICLYYLVPLLPMQTMRYRMIVYPLGQHFVDIMLLGVVLGTLLRGGTLIPKNPMNRLFAILAVMFYISMWRGWFFIGGSSPLSFSDERFSDWKNYMVLPILCLVVMMVIKNTKQMKILFALMVLSALFVNREYAHTVSTRDTEHFSYGVRSSGLLGYAGENGFGAFEAGFLVFLLAFYAYTKKVTFKAGIILFVGLGLYCLLFSFSRGAYAAFLISIIFLGLFRERKLLIFALLLLVVWQVVLPVAVQERITMTYNKGEGLDSSAQERVTLWQDALVLIVHDPIFGTGFDTYAALHRVGIYEDTHNYYLKVMVETGILGLILFLCLLGKAFRLGFRLFRQADDSFMKALGLGFASMIVCTAVANLFGDRWTYLQVNGFLWVLLGCVMRSLQLLQQQQEQESEARVPQLTPVASFTGTPGRISPA
jgi:putative inorganic carbon (HCO3(-)) transporter